MQGRQALSVLSVLAASGCSNVPAAEQGPAPILTLLHTSDLHSRVWPFRARISSFEAQLGLGAEGELQEVGGLARLGTLLDAERARAPHAIWLDSGDALEGAEIFHRFAGEAEIELLGALGLSAMALGNHELSLPPEELAKRIDEARFPILAANLSARSGSPLAGRLSSSELVQAGGVWIGVIGVANPRSPPDLAEPENRWQLDVAKDTAGAVQAAIDQLSPRVALFVVLSHLGIEEDRALVRSTSGIDLLLGGHQHIVSEEVEWAADCDTSALRGARGCRSRSVPIVHSGAYGKWLSRLELSLERDGMSHEIKALALERQATSQGVPASGRLLEALEPLALPPEAPLAFAPSRIAREAALGGDAPLGNLTTDAVRRVTGADVVLLNTSGLRADLEGGLVLRAELELVFPFAEPWRSGLVPGDVLRRGLSRAALNSAARECTSTVQGAGLGLRVRCGACVGGACLEVWRGAGESLRARERLLVVLPEYLATPGADFEELRGFTERIELDVVAALRDHFEAQPRGGGAACHAAMQRLSELGCRAAFGAMSCPVAADRARAVCASLPRVEGRRDDRIQMLP